MDPAIVVTIAIVVAVAISLPAVVSVVMLAGDVRIGVLLMLTIRSVDIIGLLLTIRSVDIAGLLLTMSAVGELLLLPNRSCRMISVLQWGRETRILMVAGRIILGSGGVVSYTEGRDGGRLRVPEDGASRFRFRLSGPPDTTLRSCGFVLRGVVIIVQS